MKSTIIAVLFLLIIGCGNHKTKEAENGLTLNLNTDIENYPSFDQSGYQLSYEIIPLEATENSFINGISRVTINDNYIYLLTKINEGGRVVIFDRSGNYVGKIDKGHANNEVVYPMDILIDERNGNIIVFDMQCMIKTFDPLGNFISAKKLDFFNMEFEKVGDRYIFYNGNMSKRTDYNFAVLDGDSVKSYVEKSGVSNEAHSYCKHITRYNGELYFIAHYDNVVYKLSEKDPEPVKFATLLNVYADMSTKGITRDELESLCGDKLFIFVTSFYVLDEGSLFNILADRSGRLNSLLYDKSTKLIYRHPLAGIPHLMTNNSYKGKTIHYFSPSSFPHIDSTKVHPQAKELYGMMKERYEKYGDDDNAYLVLVSYQKK